MKFLFFLLTFCCFESYCSAQSEIPPDSVSTQKLFNSQISSSLSGIPLLLENELTFTPLTRSNPLVLKRHLLDFSHNNDLNQYFGYSFPLGFSGSTGFRTFINPFIASETVFSLGSYQLSDRFLVGGSSFGARSVFDRPVLNPQLNDMNIRGAAFFMQYKISDKVKIETRVSITNQKSPSYP